jgi:hypothetical protein
MAENKTKATTKSVAAFVAAIADAPRRADARGLVALYRRATGFQPVLWGPSIIGFGLYHYKYASGHEGDMALAAFSPRKSAIVLYFPEFPEKKELLAQLGKCKGSKGCVYVRRLDEIDPKVLETMIKASVKRIKKDYASK